MLFTPTGRRGTLATTMVFACLSITILVISLSEIPQVLASSSTTVLVPLYGTVGNQWEPVIQAKKAHPSVPIMAIINVSNGPGRFPDPSYPILTKKLHSAGIVVLGYVAVAYGTQNNIEVMADIENYKKWYDVDGIFIDQMSNWDGNKRYYSDLTGYAKSIGLRYVIGNPGADTLPSYVGSVDAMVIYENSGLPSLQYLGGWHANYDKANWGIVPYGIKHLDTSYVINASRYVGYIGIGTNPSPHAWESLPPYFGDLVACLDSKLQQPFHSVMQNSSGLEALDGTSKIDKIPSVTSSVKYLLEEGKVKTQNYNSITSSIQIPSWVVGTEVFWKKGNLSDDEFAGEIQYLVDHGIVRFYPQ